jgi:hypothetical protein
MANYRKQLTAKTAWARVTEENRRLRAHLEAISELAAGAKVTNGEAKAALRRIRELTDAVLSRAERKAA